LSERKHGVVEKQLITAPGYSGGLGGRFWSPGLKVGPWVFLSGITAVDYEQGKTVGRGEPRILTPTTVDPEAQWRQVLGNIQAMLGQVGGTMADVVLANVFVTHMAYYYDYEWVRQEFFTEPYPVCTAVEVGSLVHTEWILEIECMAYVDN
jgi:enamine deaminase RidA (YjgF/YER057c/UK114 family)